MEFLTAQAVIDASIVRLDMTRLIDHYGTIAKTGQLVIAPADSVKVNHVVSLADL